MQTTPNVVIVSAARTAVGKAGRGTLKNTRPDDLAAAALRGAVERLPRFDLDTIDDVIIGCATHEGPQGYNVARIASLRAGFPVSVPALTINRFCASGLETIAMGAEQILSRTRRSRRCRGCGEYEPSTVWGQSLTEPYAHRTRP